MKLRKMVAAFLFNGNNEVLFLQKKPEDTFLSGHLVPIGGHIEAEEINAPDKACLREIEEETGLRSNDIKHLKLRYIVLRMKDTSEIRVQHVYFGDVKHGARLIESDEGELLWIDCTKIQNHNVTATTKEVMNHFLKVGKKECETTNNVYVGSMKSSKGEPEITWALLEDWEMKVELNPK